MKLEVVTTYTIELTPQEFRLISQALRGEIKPEWREEALALQNEMFNLRNKKVLNRMEAITNMEASDEVESKPPQTDPQGPGTAFAAEKRKAGTRRPHSGGGNAP